MSTTSATVATLYERLGGASAVDAAVDLFYRKVLADELLKPFFAGVDMDKQRKKQKIFLTYAFGGPNHSTGRGLRNAHREAVEKGMADAHFDRVIALLGATLKELGVAKPLIAEARAIAESTRDDVLGR